MAKNKRTITPEHLKKMQNGRKRKQMLDKRKEGIKNLEYRLYIGAHKK
mgnify:CR=1 FL=1